MESSQTRDLTLVLCIDRQILNHWTTREVQKYTQLCYSDFSNQKKKKKVHFAFVCPLQSLAAPKMSCGLSCVWVHDMPLLCC